MDVRKVKKLIELLEASSIGEIEIKEGDDTVRISRSSSAAPAIAPPPTPPQNVPVVTGEPAAKESSATSPSHLHAVDAPMVGTFYRSSSPDTAPFVEVGSKVKKGEPLCIIEAMKMMNHIEAPVAGIVEEILIENAEPVEFGQTIIRIDPS